MTTNWKEVARSCLEGAESGAMTFPQIVGALTNAGFDGYTVDLRCAAAIYYFSVADRRDDRTGGNADDRAGRRAL